AGTAHVAPGLTSSGGARSATGDNDRAHNCDTATAAATVDTNVDTNTDPSMLVETSFSGPKTVTRKVSTSSAKNSSAMLVTVVQPDVTPPARLPSNGSGGGDELSPWHVSVGSEPGPRKTVAPPRRVSSTEQRRVITTEL
ncbi:hypothetical protein LSAT2_024036, partial [Lamellibrachia satsuma]